MISLESKWVHFSVSVKRVFYLMPWTIQYSFYCTYVLLLFVREIKSVENTKTALIFIVCLPRDSREIQREEILWGLQCLF